MGVGFLLEGGRFFLSFFSLPYHMTFLYASYVL